MHKQTKRFALAAAGLVPIVLAAQKTCAQMIYEPFDYGSAAAGTNLGNLTGTSPSFTGYVNPMNGIPWWDCNTTVSGTTGNEVILANPGNNLSVSGLQPSTGNLVQYNVAANANGGTAAGSRTARLNLQPGPVSSGTIYYSMLFRVTDPANLNNAGGSFFAAFNEEPNTFSPGTNPGNDPGRLQLRLGVNAGSIQVGVKCNTNAAALYDTVHEFKTGANADTIFAVVGVTFKNGTASDDESNLWINPDPSTWGQATQPSSGSFSQTSGTDVPGIMSMILRQGNALIAKGIDVDEVRVDTSWSQVTAPAGTTWSGGAGGTWSSGANWSGGVAPGGAARFVNFYDGPAGSVIVDTPQTVGTINLKNTAGYNLVGSTITFDAGGAAGMSAVNLYAPMDATGPGTLLASSHTIANPLQLNNPFEANVARGGNLNLVGSISGNVGIIKNGAGYLTLGGTNSQAGDTQLNNGTVIVSSDANLGAAANQLVFNGGALLTLGSFNSSRNIVVQAVTIGTAGTFGHGTIDTNGNNVSITGTLGGPGTLNKTGAGALTVQHVRTPALNILNGSVKINGGGGNNGTTNTKSLTIAGATDAWTAAFNLNDSGAIIDYGTTSPLATIQNQLKSGFAGGSWNGNGINSSAAAAAASTSTKTGVGYIEAVQMFGSFPATFMGQSVPDNTAVIMRHTLAGDADLSLSVDLTDFTFLAANFNKQTGATWRDGDFDYNGTVDLTDFTLLAGNFNKTLSPGPAAGLGAQVPEPASLVAALGAGIGFMMGRRRHRR